jgi:glycosyltransferase involved in cell wall biosynthesis
VTSIKPKKILVVVESIDVEDSSGAKGRVALIRNLRLAGYDPVVYHYSRKNISLENIPCVPMQENRRSILFFLSRLERYLRYYLKLQLNRPLEKVFGFSFTLLNDRNSILSALKEVNFQPDLVFTLSKGGSFRPHHALLQIPEWHDRWVAYIHDPYPMHLYPKPYPWKESGYKQKEEFIGKIAENAQFPVFPSLLLKEWMGQFFEGYRLKGEVIPHQVDNSYEPTGALPVYFDKKKFNLLHAGNLLQARQPQWLVKAFENFLGRVPEAKQEARLLMIGRSGHHTQYLKSKAAENMAIIVIPENRTFKEVRLLQEKSSVNIILEAKSEISPFLPGKFAHCVKADRPILHLGPKNSETRRLLGEEYSNVAGIDEVSNISEIIEKLYFRWKKDNNLRLHRPDLEEYLSPTYLKEVVENLLKKK